MNKVVYVLFIFLFLMKNVAAQDSHVNGIQFVQLKKWNEILELAKKENKKIFIDVFATWCMPCKLMDQKVYTEQNVAKFFNTEFVSVKIQMDSTKSDQQDVKNWYPFANYLKNNFSINGFPTFMFFANDGRFLHSGLGYKDPETFLKLGSEVINYQDSIFSQLQQFRNGSGDKVDLNILYNYAYETKNKPLMDSLVKKYKLFLDGLSEHELLDKTNLQLIGEISALISSQDRIFKIALLHPELLKSLAPPGFSSRRLVYGVIIREEIRSKINKTDKNEEPDWNDMSFSIKRKYPSINTDSLLLKEQIKYFKKNKEWKTFAKLQNQYFDKYPVDTSGDVVLMQVNGVAWEVFQYCDDKEVLEQALTWSDWSIRLKSRFQDHFQFLDTKANLLYKLGKVKEAICVEEYALKTFRKYSEESVKNGGRSWEDPYFASTLSKMREGLSTWPTNNPGTP